MDIATAVTVACHRESATIVRDYTAIIRLKNERIREENHSRLRVIVLI